MTPTPPPALTDEQIMVAHDDFRYAVTAGFPNADPYLVRQRFDTYIAAVIALAKREERERIGAEIEEANRSEIWHPMFGYGLANAAAIARTPAPIPPSSEDRCDRHGLILDCGNVCRRCRDEADRG